MKKTKRVLSVLLCVALVLSLGTATAFAEENEACTLTQGCTLEAGHAGDCVLTQEDENDSVQDITALIEALPGSEEITAENADDVIAQLNAIDDAKAKLSEEQLESIDFAKYEAATAAVLALQGENTGVPATMALSEVYVSSSGDDSNTGETPEQAVKTIEKALELSQSNRTVYLLNTYTFDQTDIAYTNFTIKPATNFTGSNLIEVTGKISFTGVTIDGTNKSGISNLVNVKGNANLILANVTIKNAAGSHAMYVRGTSKDVRASVGFRSGSIKDNNVSGAGTVYIGDYADFELTGGKISDNTANEGGGVTLDGDSTFTLKNDAEISGNTATGAAGGMSIHEGTANLEGGSITGNKAPYSGGIEAYTYSTSSKIKINLSGTQINENIATDMYGGIFISGSNLEFEMTGGTVNGNTADTDAGGICVYDNAKTSFKGGEIKNNEAAYGAGLEILGANVVLEGTTIEGNAASSNGGGVLVMGQGVGSGSFTLKSGSVINNTADGQGAGIFAVTDGYETSVEIKGGKIAANTVDGEENAVTLADYYGDEPDENTEFSKLYMSGSPEISGAVMLNDWYDYGPKIEINGEFTPVNPIKIKDIYGREGRTVVSYKAGLTPKLSDFTSAYAPKTIIKENGQDIVWHKLINVRFRQWDGMPATKWVTTNIYIESGTVLSESDIPASANYKGYTPTWYVYKNGKYTPWNPETPITADTILTESWAFNVPDVTMTADKTRGCENSPITLTANVQHELDTATFTYQWYCDGQPIDDAVESTYVVTETGEYYVEVTATDDATSQSKTAASEPVNCVIEHQWNSHYTVDKEPTCTQKGEQSIHCAICDTRTSIEEMEPAGHDWENHYTVDKAPTCTQEGEQSLHCTVCDARTKIEAIPAQGHTSDKWFASETSHYQECDVCGKKFNEGDHTFGDWKITKNATSTQTGLKEKACTVCNYKVSEVIAKTAATNTAVKTGQESNMMLYVVIIAAAAACIAFVALRMRKRNNK